MKNVVHLFLVAALIGHNWPIYFGYRDGRGFSVIFGSFLALHWLGEFSTTIIGLLLGIIVLENLIIAYSGWLWLMIPWLFIRSSSFSLVAIFLLAATPEIKEFRNQTRNGKLES